MSKVEIKGNKNHETVGLMVRRADAIVKECKIHGHQMGGVLVWSGRQNRVNVINSKIVFNSRCGLHLGGDDANCLIEGNKIEHNSGAGVKIGIANRSTIIRNEIKMN
jgi:F-box protein 11